MRHYCTLFDINYLPRFVTMYQSMVRTQKNFLIFAFCMDDESYKRIVQLNFVSVSPISIHQLEEFDKDLYAVKQTRSLVEYYFTSTPAICNFVLNNNPSIESITYLDADLYFFSSAEVVFEEIGDNSIAIIEHRFSRFGRHFIKNGRFNVAWITFKNNDIGKQCLSDYRNQCLEWCYDYLEGDKYGDQKYLDKWPEKYNGVRIIQNLGVNLAPWNLSNYYIYEDKSHIYVNSNELVFFHFANLKQLSINKFTTSVSSYFEFLPQTVKMKIYIPYIIELKRNSEYGNITRKAVNPKYKNFSLSRNLKNLIRLTRLYLFRDIIKI